MRLCCFYGYFAHVFCFFWSRSYESQQHTLRYFMLVCNLVGLFKYHSDLQITVSKNLSNVDDCHLIRLIIKCFILNFLKKNRYCEYCELKYVMTDILSPI